VQTHKYSARQYVGDPINVFRIFNDKGVDEISLTDIDASRYFRKPNFRLLENIVSESFIPVTYGGGIHDVETARTLFEIGIEKIAVNATAQSNPERLLQLVGAFGSQSIVGVVDVTVKELSAINYLNSSIISPVGIMLHQFVESGVGEIRLNDVNRDGTLSGLNIDFFSTISREFDVPIVVSGGTSSVKDIRRASQSGINAIAVGAMVVLYGPHRAVLVSYPNWREQNE